MIILALLLHVHLPHRSFDNVLIVVIYLSSYIVDSFLICGIALVIYVVCSSLSKLANNSKSNKSDDDVF